MSTVPATVWLAEMDAGSYTMRVIDATRAKAMASLKKAAGAEAVTRYVLTQYGDDEIRTFEMELGKADLL